MQYEVMVYYKGGGAAVYPVSALNSAAAKGLGRYLSSQWEPNMPIVKVTAQRLAVKGGKPHTYNPAKPFGDPFYDTEDLSTHPSSAWFA